MDNDGKMSISEFSKWSGITRRNLIFYDKQGVLKPELRGENNYRYYSYYQLGVAWALSLLREIGLPLSEIRTFLDNRSPEEMIRFYGHQIRRLASEQQRLGQIMTMMQARIDVTAQGLGVDETEIRLELLPEEELVMSDEPGPDDTAVDMIRDLFRRHRGIVTGVPSGFFYSRERLLRRDWHRPGRYYYRTPHSGDKRPEGLYAVGHIRCGFREPFPLFERLTDYIEKENLIITGDAYEDYIFNEMAIASAENYLIRIAIRVERSAP
ncbi:MerR family transcriptional regulator [Oscillospiraceae bacterium OttesenSCG-928-F05]|nr:MerR family transcriptional regulator [Oscillospiraceae bacterium OttesenSCG-928-F05]